MMSLQQSFIDGAYKVDIPKPRHETQQRGVLDTPQQVRSKIGEALSLRANFTPQMLTALAMRLADELVGHCRSRRIRQVQQQQRMMMLAIDRYDRALMRYYGEAAAKAYAHYFCRFMAEVATDIALLRLKLSELAANQLPQIEDREPAILTTAICGIACYVDWYDAEMDRRISERLGRQVRCRPNRCLDVVKALCVTIADTLHCRISPDRQGAVSAFLNVLGNRATLLAESMMADEAQEG